MNDNDGKTDGKGKKPFYQDITTRRKKGEKPTHDHSAGGKGRARSEGPDKPGFSRDQERRGLDADRRPSGRAPRAEGSGGATSGVAPGRSRAPTGRPHESAPRRRSEGESGRPRTGTGSADWRDKPGLGAERGRPRAERDSSRRAPEDRARREGSARPEKTDSYDKPGFRRDRPAAGRDRPAAGRDRPAEGRDRSAAGRDRPATGRDRPAAGRPAGGGSRESDPRGRPARTYEPFVPSAVFDPVFGAASPEVVSLLEWFPELVKATLPLDSRKALQLGEAIRDLSHELTDERGERRVGYMNEPAALSAYVNYFMWWNLVRLTRLFAAMPLTLEHGDALVDLGSGPLTLPIALWMARPDLRALKLSWYCMDISQGALAAGEEMFLHLVAKTGGEPWKIVRVKGECGTSLRRKVRLVASANMFNELFQDNPEPLEAQAKRQARDLVSYADETSSILVVEPGVPRSARFISLLRDALIRLDFAPLSPCPHDGPCPFPGLRHGKWCHFVFDTAPAPARLHKLSEEAGLSKDRAALSFILASRVASSAAEQPTEQPTEPPTEPVAGTSGAEAQAEPGSVSELATDAATGQAPDAATGDAPASRVTHVAPTEADAVESLSMVSRMAGLFTGLKVRIVSDPIRLPDFYTGRYGCSEIGMVLVCGTYQAADYLATCNSGSCIEVPRPDRKRPERDPKTDAILIRLK